MCGRANYLELQKERVAEEFGLNEVPPIPVRYNITPGVLIHVIGQHPAKTAPTVAQVKWGFVPPRAIEPPTQPYINAKGETVDTLASFQLAFSSRDPLRAGRCLIPVTGVYEWRRRGRNREAFHIRRRDRGLIALAGLWAGWTDGETSLVTGCIITTEPNALFGEIHDRMPVIIPNERYRDWLNPATKPAELKKLLVPFPVEPLEMYPVSDYVNKPGNEGPKCIEPLVGNPTTALPGFE
ncbi:MAG: hypothetical protein JWO38_8273 [Gemmataceae bacterium]|nr:hypothetical protein [Gemmataceae bacterium]